MITALVAVCVAFQGEVRAEFMSPATLTSLQVSNCHTDPIVQDRIIHKAAEETEYSVESLQHKLNCGELSIDKIGLNLYVVQIRKNDGGNTIISIIDDF